MPLIADNVRSLYASLVVAALAITAFVLGRDLLVPLAIAVSLAFILSPIANWLVAKGLARAVAVTGLLIVLIAGLGVISSIVSSQMLALTGELSTYKQNVIQKVRTVAGASRSDGMLKRASEALEGLEKDMKRELAKPADQNPVTAPAQERIIVAGERQTNGLWDIVTAVGHPLAQIGLTFLLTLFMLLQAQDLRDRIVRVVGTDNLSGTTAALGDAADRLSRVLLAQALLNIGFGIAVGIALAIIGVPNAILWGGLTIVMRFVPYVGSLIAAIPPVLLAAAVDPGWGMAVATLAVFAIGEPIMGHLVEPFVLGSSAGLSPFAMLLSASFWATVWGPIGLILAAPITMTFVVLGRYIKGLEFITVLLGDEPALSPEQRLYHRLLSGDVLAATHQLDDAVEADSLVDAGDAILFPALHLAALDLDRGRLESGRPSEIRETAFEAIQQCFTPSAELPRRDASLQQAQILIVPARSQLDVAAADFVSFALSNLEGLQSKLLTPHMGLTALSQASSTGEKAEAIVITSAGGEDAQYLPLIARRARRNFPTARVLILDGSGGVAGSRQPTDDSEDAGLRFTKLRDLLPQLTHIPPPRPDHAAVA